MTSKPVAPACERNRLPILKVIKPLLEDVRTLLEIGSGTGQHAVYFGSEMPHLLWQTSDVEENHIGIQLWLQESELDNVLAPLTLNVSGDWPDSNYDAMFSANTAHIMPWRAVEAMFAGVACRLNPRGLFIIYGPFNYHGQFSSDSNRQFEQWLKSVDPERGIRDFEALQELAAENNLLLLQDYEMPANNHILVWQIQETESKRR